MRAIQYSRFGSFDVLEEVTLERPEPSAGELLVAVEAASVNPLDWKLREGEYKRVFKRALPYVPGSDICGRVVSTGPGASRFQEGDRVFGFLDPRKGGGYAEFAVIDQTRVAAAPDGADPAVLAALPCAGLTALQALARVPLHEESRVLVIGAAGGVGHLAAQIGKARGARVNGVCGPDSVEWVQALGVNRAVDYSVDRYLEEATSYDLIFDAVAAQSYQACKPILKRKGTYLTTLMNRRILTAIVLTRLGFKGKAGLIICTPESADLARLAEMMAAGSLKPLVETRLPLVEARRAQELSANGHARGKIVLTVSP